jgi:hypothetical protein
MLDHKAEAQELLDELFRNRVLGFKLTVFLVEHLGGEKYIVRFHDSRLPSIDLSWHESQAFKDIFRTAMVNRLDRMSGDVVKRKSAHDQTES